MSLEGLTQDPFNADEFVERLAWRVLKKSDNSDEPKFDPVVLHGAFCQTISLLKEHERKLEKKALLLEQQCVDEESIHRRQVKELLVDNQQAFQNFQELDERVNAVATKVVHLGDQLESVNIPRARNADALHMMQYLNHFFEEGNGQTAPADGLFEDPFKLEEAAELVQKLNSIAQELPTGDEKFDCARRRVTEVYSRIESNLIDGFLNAYKDGELAEMKKMSDFLKNFRRYNDVIERFIEESQKNAFKQPTKLFQEIEQLCVETSEIVTQVFVNPESVMSRFVTNIYHGALLEHISDKLDVKKTNTEFYLIHLSDLYESTTKLSDSLSEKLKLGSDTTFLVTLTKKLFTSHLDKYVNTELNYLEERSSSLLHRYYMSKNHQKRSLQAGGLSDITRGVQAKMHINIGRSVEDFSGEVFLSQEVAISILQEFKLAYSRGKVLISAKDLPKHASDVYNILVQYVCSEFIDYAIELALYHCPLPDSKVEPNLHFFQAVSDTSAIVHLFEKQFSDSLWPIISRSPQKECVNVKTNWIEQYEQKLDLGLERTLMAICGFAKNILTTEQKKTDFKPETTNMNMMHSSACAKLASYITKVITAIKTQLDGRNVVNMLTELGIRVHKLIYEHMLTFPFNSTGAMLAICDINEYRNCLKQLGSEEVTQLFDVLHALCNLLVVTPDNLRQVCVGEPLGHLDKSILMSFIQLRNDYKTSKLATVLGR